MERMKCSAGENHLTSRMLQGVGMSPRADIRPYSGALCCVWGLNHVGTAETWGCFGPGCLWERCKKRRGKPGKACWWDKGLEGLMWKDQALRSGA